MNRFFSVFITQGILLLFFITTALLLNACAIPVDVDFYETPMGSDFIESVPYFKDSSHHYGPASMAAVLNYQGVTANPKEIAAAVFDNSVKGAEALDMVLYVRGSGTVDAQWYNGDVHKLVEAVNDNQPLIVQIQSQWKSNDGDRFLVVKGYNPEGVFASTISKKNDFIHWNEFMRQWNQTGRWTLVVFKDE